MRALLTGLDAWRAKGRRWAIARVIDVEGSGPREPGAAMAVSEDGEVLGSVSGGCVEGAVVQAALEVIASHAAEFVSFGYSDDDAFTVGLTCGGTIHLLIQPGEQLSGFERLTEAVQWGRPAAWVTVVEGNHRLGATALLRPGLPLLGSLGNAELDRVVARDAEGELGVGSSRVRRYGPRGEARRSEVGVFVHSFSPPVRMIIFGAVDFAGALSQVASVLGFRVILCDAREMFATRARFPFADEVVVDWPHRLLGRIGSTLTGRDAVCVLTHEARFDVPAVIAALQTDVGYLGAMGSRRTHEDRMKRLREAGAEEADLVRLNSPIGLDLGARTPEETAVSICAEIIARRAGVEVVQSLGRVDGPIHAPVRLVRAIGD
jgi:xanthine dehydrogenase accessory factor